jgi:hypothetical protein
VIKSGIWIARTPDEVFDYLLGGGARNPGAGTIQGGGPITDPDVDPETAFREWAAHPEPGNWAKIERPYLLEMRFEGDGGMAHMRYRLAPDQLGTRLEMAFDMKMPGRFGTFLWLFMCLFGRFLGPSMRTELEKMKADLEGPPVPAAGE